jgi:hypothetical protein
MVRKMNDKYRMCTNFTDLNKCCPKDDFPLSRIDKVVDSVASGKTMALLDCFLSTIKFGSAKRMKKKQDSSCLSSPIVTSGCPKASRMLAPCSVG